MIITAFQENSGMYFSRLSFVTPVMAELTHSNGALLHVPI